ncbi:MAG: beta strand repeat-containing protein, partial [Erythrobacter sp.]
MTLKHAPRDRTRLMLGCASAALALALATSPTAASAQGIQGDSSVVFGVAEVSTPTPTNTTVDVFSPTVVIDWSPKIDANGNALDFLRTGAEAFFRSPEGTNFAVLNRILPAPNNNIAVIDGSVVSQIAVPNGFVKGGFVAFYSPTGILVGNNASFDVGRLMLTTLDTTNEGFDAFAGGSFSFFQGASGSRATITVSPGARIDASPQNGFFAIVAADVEMRGTAYVNGSHAYIAGEAVSLRFSNGLFDISIPTGTAASGEVVTLNGTIGGTASTGAGDNRMIYAVARAAQDPISMLLSGNIGFDPAASASIINGEIILAANYNVSQRFIQGTSIREDIASVRYRRPNSAPSAQADITIRDVNASSSLYAIGTGQTRALASGANSAITGNLVLFGGIGASAEAGAGRSLTVSGDLLVDARDTGVNGSGLQSLDVINAQGGTARVVASGTDALVSVGGRAIVTADAFAGFEIFSRAAGTARGGTAEVLADGGRVTIAGDASVRASAFGTDFFLVNAGAESRGGTARMLASNGGSASLGGSLEILATARGATGQSSGTSSPSNAFGGTASLGIDGLGTIGITGSATIDASAVADIANATGAGALADAGAASILLDGDNQLTINGNLTMRANARGGANVGGKGGQALGGVALATARGGGRLTLDGAFSAQATAGAGNGVNGGDAAGGVAGARAVAGAINLKGIEALADANGQGGNAFYGYGGTGGTGRGGTALFMAMGSSSLAASLEIAGLATLRADGRGGFGGNSDEIAIAGGRGGDAFGGDATTDNQADATFKGGAYLLASGDYGRIAVGSDANVSVIAIGGEGGSGRGAFVPGRGGNATGGFAQAGLAQLGGPGTVGGGVAQFGRINLGAQAFGGKSGVDGNIAVPAAVGGDGQGGTTVLSAYAGALTAGGVFLNSGALGGDGSPGGIGRGGTARVEGGASGSLAANSLFLDATARGGFGYAGAGGAGFGGKAGIALDGLNATISGNLSIDATGRGQTSLGGEGGDGERGDGGFPA